MPVSARSHDIPPQLARATASTVMLLKQHGETRRNEEKRQNNQEVVGVGGSSALMWAKLEQNMGK